MSLSANGGWLNNVESVKTDTLSVLYKKFKSKYTKNSDNLWFDSACKRKTYKNAIKIPKGNYYSRSINTNGAGIGKAVARKTQVR